jgi:uncharacterized membrane protein (UPF0127 family)
MKYILPLLLVVMAMGIGWLVYQKKTDAAIISEWLKMEDHGETTIYINEEALILEVVNTDGSRAQGLSDRMELPHDGMLFAFEDVRQRSFWMKNMNFALDMVWVKDEKVVGVTENAAVPAESERENPTTFYTSPSEANVVIELAAGRAKQLGIEVDDEILTQ